MNKVNLAVGVAGLVVTAVTLGLLVSNWEGLAAIGDYRAQVTSETETASLDGESPAPGTEDAAVGQVNVTQANVTWLSGVFTWQESAPPLTDVWVTLRVTDPAGAVRLERTQAGGGPEGFRFNFTLGGIPAGRAYHDTEAAAQGRFADDFVGTTTGTGVWTFEVSVRGEGPLLVVGPTSAQWNLDVTWTHWQATLSQDPPADFTGK